jgi:hypothetical protein
LANVEHFPHESDAVPDASDPLIGLVNTLGFAGVDNNTAIGELHGVPTTLTVLGNDPPAAMFAFRVNPDGQPDDAVGQRLGGLPEELAALSCEDGYAWLSLYNLEKLPANAAARLVEQIADSISSTDLALAPGCLQCGASDAQIISADGRPTRLCGRCVAAAAEEHRERVSELNRPTVGATLAVPGAGLFVAAGWAVIWTVIDFTLERWQIRVVEINHFSGMIGLLAFGIVGVCLGWPMGATLRQSIALRHAPRLMSAVATLGAALLGEILYVAARLFLLAGVFDVGVAARLLPQVIATYTGFWVACKLLLAGSIGVCCGILASQRKTASLPV